MRILLLALISFSVLAQDCYQNSNYDQQSGQCLCIKNYYKIIINLADACQACPLGSSSLAGSVNLNQCSCDDLNTIPLVSGATYCQCKTGYYGTGITSGSCQMWPLGSTCYRGARNISQCSCTGSNTIPLEIGATICECKAGYYGRADIQGQCSLCPQGSSSNIIGAQYIQQCTCLDTNTIPLVSGATTCKCNAGSYGTGQTSGSCQLCPTGSNSTSGATDISQCTCLDTNTIPLVSGATTCKCNAGSYGTGETSGSCQLCPTGSNSTSGATDISQCTCQDTNTIPLVSGATTCQCKAGSYGTGETSGSCQLCPQGSSSQSGSTQFSSCQCKDSNTIPLVSGASTCQCKTGYYGTAITSGSCQTWPLGSICQNEATDISQCTCQDTNTIPLVSGATTCQCNAGLYGTGETSGSCQICPQGSSSQIGSKSFSSCQCNDSNTIPLVSGASTCQCKTGYYGTAITSGSCQTWPLGSICQNEATDISQCTCQDTNTIPLVSGATTCQCNAGLYGTGETSGSCQICPQGSNSTSGSTDISQCTCLDINTIPLVSGATSCQCKTGYYGTGITSGSCKIWPVGSSCQNGATDISQCTCQDTNTIPLVSGATTCQCKAGSYGTGETSGSCQLCPQGSSSQSGSTQFSQCQCEDINTIPLFTGSQQCQCKIGYYGTAQLKDSCQICPEGLTTSNPGSENSDKCISFFCANIPTLGSFEDNWCNQCQIDTPYASKDKSKCIASDCTIQPSIGKYSNTWCNNCETEKKYSNLQLNSCVISNCSEIPKSGQYTNSWCSDCNTINTATNDKNQCGKNVDDSKATTQGIVATSIASILIILINLLL